MRSMRTPGGGSCHRARGHQGGAELSLFYYGFVNTPTGAVVTKQVPINTNLSLKTLLMSCFNITFVAVLKAIRKSYQRHRQYLKCFENIGIGTIQRLRRRCLLQFRGGERTRESKRDSVCAARERSLPRRATRLDGRFWTRWHR